MKFCRKDIPEMACIVCNQQAVQEGKPENKVTPEWVKKNAKSPIHLIKIIMLQISKNQMISEFADFFVQVLPVMMAVQGPSQTK